MRTRLGVGIAVASLMFSLVACSNPPAASQGPTQSQAAAASSAPAASQSPDYLTMSRDPLTAGAKNGKDLIFSAWWGEEYWKEVAKQFTKKYGIETRFLLGNNAIEKILAEKDRATGTIDVQLIGGQDVKTSIDAGLWYGPVLPALPDHAKLDAKLSSVQEGVQTGGFLVPIYRNQTGVLYDPNRVATPPQTWGEFKAWLKADPQGFAYPDPNKRGPGP